MNKPQILYKYRTISENTEKIFTDKKIWLSKPEMLNDPFECSIANFTDRAKKKMIEEYRVFQVCNFAVLGEKSLSDGRDYFGLQGKDLKKFLKRMKVKSWDKRYKMISNLVYEANGVHLSNPIHVIKSLESRLHDTGIFSLSETDTNQLMWAHYGGESKGLALGFEVTEGSKLADDDYCLPVNYSNELPKFDPKELMTTVSMKFGNDKTEVNFKVPFTDPTFRMCVSTKPTDWDYEKEWRYIDECDGLHPFPGKLTEVVFGLRCSEQDKKKYRELANNNFDYPIHFYEIVKKPNQNQIEKILCE